MTDFDFTEEEGIAILKVLNRVALGEASEENIDLGPIDAANKFIERIDELEHQVEELETKLEMIEQDASTALGVANETSDGARADGGPSDQKRAEWLSRNEVVRDAITGKADGGSVTAGDVKSMARPETNLYHKQVSRAWEKLIEKWPAFRYERPDDGKDRLKADREDLPVELVRLVERDLDRDDLVETLRQKTGGR